MSDATSRPDWTGQLDGFLDAVALRQPTPGGGAVAGAAGALACAMARMVAAYSAKKSADPETAQAVTELTAHLERADHVFRDLVAEDARAYTALAEAARRLKNHSDSKPDHDTALRVAIAVPMQMTAAACQILGLLKRLLPVANRYLLSDLRVAAVLAEATARAANEMVRVNTALLDDATARSELEDQSLQLVGNARGLLADIQSDLSEQL